MTAFLEAIIASIVGAAIYGLIFSQREEKIREYFRAAAHGWFRNLYIHAMIGAIRRDAAVTSSRIPVTLMLFALLGAYIVVSYDAINLESEWRSIGTTVSRLSEDLSVSAGKIPNPEVSKTESRREMDAIIAKHQQLQPGVLRRVRFERILAWVLLIMFDAGWLFWRPYVLMRTRFAHEAARFALRMQGLASKDELTRLTAAELSVIDPDTLRRYVETMKEIATRHGVPDLTKTFELWRR